MKRVISTLVLILVISYVILTAHALAETPEGLKNTSRLERHQEAMRLAGTTFQSRPAMGRNGSFDEVNPISETLAGAAQKNLPSGTFKTVHAKWVLPQIDLPAGSEGKGSLAMYAWIGIDGVKQCGGLLRGGSFTLLTFEDNDEDMVTMIWAQWGSGRMIFLNFAKGLEPGQNIEATITADGVSKAEIVVTNLSTIETQGAPLTSPGPDEDLCGLLARWMVEDPTVGGATLAFPYFSPVTFSDCSARTTDGDLIGTTGASLIKMQRNNQVLASVSDITGSTVTIQHGSS